jgi:cytochrome o ubiquinol oxidase operon protein cyoD
MSVSERGPQRVLLDIAPGDEATEAEPGHIDSLTGYFVGLGFAVLLTAVSFFVAKTTLVWTPSIPVALGVLAVAQMGVHVAFFLHVGTGPDSVNNVMALAFGVLIVVLVIGGSLFIMDHLNHNMPNMGQMMQMQR